MPKAFSEKEREWIKHKLFVEGQKLFEKYGIQKTSIDEIVKNVGISKGSFYLFYSSKEELFFDIIEKIEREFKENLTNEIFKEKNFKNSFKKFLLKGFEFIENTPLLKYLSGSEIEFLMRKIPEERILSHMNKDIEQIIKIIAINDKKKLSKRELKGIIAFLKLIPHIIFHKEELEKDEYEAMKDTLCNMLINYLIKE